MDGELHQFRTLPRPVAPDRFADDLARADVQDLLFAYLRIEDPARRLAVIDVVRRLAKP